tara:strand:+ start:221 stop:607 length:387 start_codon:yes stop_codon:yes gene_type:complete
MSDLFLLEEFIREAVLDEAKKKRKAAKKRTAKKRAAKKGRKKASKAKKGPSSSGLSAKTKATLRKKAESRGFTVGSVMQEYKRGLAAWVSSGSRKGMGQHQWAMARVNSASPSKPWACVKKSKAKKKK